MVVATPYILAKYSFILVLSYLLGILMVESKKAVVADVIIPQIKPR